VGKISWLVTLLGSLDCCDLNYVAGLKELEGLNERINYCYISVVSIKKKKADLDVRSLAVRRCKQQ